MKTTIELSDAVLEEAKRLARSEGTSLRAIIERALRRELADQATTTSTFRLRDASVDGRGLREEYADGEWSTIRDAIYERRGA